ncbi:mitochondrial 37S ribosomal protein rsm10 [Recurvomyces mirabilis]|uniref:Small ribosomal subunit protein uS10m n=1 Tax=Recurvomyces mirabilis TaxID=574656 RepID=A0AAE1C393_9PEZI|nr:mitochondrial 37S ribosomal protein rsm10 [Recurvomyces mirabilis]KAK5154887.1 mitochondrial 37S ribosomal protein rsm10 [Recurvomyces mirabilis]
MSGPSCARALISATKRVKISSPTTNGQCLPLPRCTISGTNQRRHDSTVVEASRHLDLTPGAAEAPPTSITPANIDQELANLRLPRAVQATYLDPLRHPPTLGIKTAELQLRSYSIRNLEVFTDFCLRAAYYLKLAAKGPIALPRQVERWTVPRSNFVHKKSQENFERRTVSRGIKILDGHPEVVATWLAFVKKHQYYGVGMKANVWEYGSLETGKDMDAEAERIAGRLGEQLDLVGGKEGLMVKHAQTVEGMLGSEPFKARWGAYAAMGGAGGVPSAGRRVESVRVGKKAARARAGKEVDAAKAE